MMLSEFVQSGKVAPIRPEPSRRSIAAANGMINRLPQLAAATTSAVRRFRGSPREASLAKFTG
jgi:hypothetical protein